MNSNPAARSLCPTLVVLALCAGAGFAQQPSPPPLPLHGIEGYGGVLATYSAYLVNPPRSGAAPGLPAAEVGYVWLGHQRYLVAATVTENFFGVFELGYGWDDLHLGDLPEAVFDATGAELPDRAVGMHNFNGRLNLIKENAFDQRWLPAITVGAHYKSAPDVEDMDTALGGGLEAMGITDTEGWDYTLYLSKTFDGRTPLVVNLGARSTAAAQIGLLGFTDERKVLVEGNLVWFVAPTVGLAAEYRQKESDYTPIPGLFEAEEDWYTVDLCFVLSSHMTIAGGWGHFGDVLNHSANRAWAAKVKWEF